MMNATFRRNRDGEWTVFGPATVVLAGEFCQVSRADGSVRRIYVSTVSRSFDVNGTPYVYGTIGQAPRRAAAPRARRAAAPAPVAPVSFGAPVEMSYEASVAADEAAAEAEAESSEFNVF